MDYSVCTINPKRHYFEFEKGQYDRQAVHTEIRNKLGDAKIDKITPVSPTLWLVETLTELDPNPRRTDGTTGARETCVI